MLYASVRDVMDVVFSVCIMKRGTVGARVCEVGVSCRCCMFVSCVLHPVAVLNAALCMTYSLLMLVEDERDDHMEEQYYRAGFMTTL